MKELSEKSLCNKCIHKQIEDGVHCCPAFPPFPPFNGIPERYLSGEKEHTKVDDDQDVSAIFQDEDPYPSL